MNRFLRILALAGALALAPIVANATALPSGVTTAGGKPVDVQPSGQVLSDGSIQPPPWGVRVSATTTRPANTTTYTTNTAWANATSAATYVTFTHVCRANGTTVLITEADLDDFANQTTKLQVVLWLFSVAPTAINDDATFSIASADMANKVAPISFTASTVANQGSGASGITTANIPAAGLQATCAANDNNLYGMWQVVNAYVPVSAEVLTGTIKVVGVN